MIRDSILLQKEGCIEVGQGDETERDGGMESMFNRLFTIEGFYELGALFLLTGALVIVWGVSAAVMLGF